MVADRRGSSSTADRPDPPAARRATAVDDVLVAGPHSGLLTLASTFRMRSDDRPVCPRLGRRSAGSIPPWWEPKGEHFGGMSGWEQVPSVRCMYRDQDHHSPAALLERADEEKLSLPCRVYDPDLWFADTQADLDAAKRLCAPCPIRLECLETAVARAEPWGVWGGEIVAAGAVIPHKPRRGRPRRAHPHPATCVA